MKLVVSLCAAVLGLFFLMHPVTSHAGKKNAKPVHLSVTAPFLGGRNSIQNSSGWSIAVRLHARRELGIANSDPDEATPAGTFPKIGQTGWIVFDDPDGCLTLFPPFDPPFFSDDSCAGATTDETFLMFTPDIDQVGLIDDAGDADRRAALTDSGGGGRSTFLVSAPDGSPFLAALGADTGGDIVDGYGRGADDDLPGLVVLSATGPGLVLDENFDRGSVLEQYNLAGFLNQVTYELTDITRHTTVLGNMLVPYGLIAPFVKADACVGTNTDPAFPVCDLDPIWRIDGGPIELIEPPGAEPLQEGYPTLFDASRYEMTFFAVSGIAPSILSDMDGNGRITAKDAEFMGYNVISNEVKIRFNQFHGLPCFRPTGSQILLADLDGNGQAVQGIVCPGGPGGLTKPPR